VQSLAFSGLLPRYPHFLWTDLLAAYGIGPLLYLFVRAQSAQPPDELRFTRGQLWHLALPALAGILLAPYCLLSAAEKTELIAAVAAVRQTNFLEVFRTGSLTVTPVLTLVAYGSEASVTAYTLRILWDLRGLWRDTTRWISAMLAGDAAILSVLGLGSLAGYTDLARLSVLGVTGTICLLYFVSQAVPAYFTRVFEEARTAKYRKSRLAGIATGELERRLFDYLRAERPYLREELTLADLSAALGVTPHQLSEFLNDRLGKSFHHLVNEYRVRAACELLADTDDTVLSIAYAVGFNNRASFNAAFTRFTGTTPVLYRKEAATNSRTIRTSSSG
jgi:AraC-like DNA-binding protein